MCREKNYDGRQEKRVYKQNIVIVGAGIVGLSTAYALLKQRNYRVTVLEQLSVDSPHATSHGVSRLLRFEYGADAFYSCMVQQSLTYWRMLEDISQRVLYTPTGILMLGNKDDNFTSPSYSVLHDLGLPITRLSQQQCRQRFPQFMIHKYDMYSYNRQGGILHASQCLRTLRDLILDLGGEICEATRVKHIDYGNMHRSPRVTLLSGDVYKADCVVIAVGPWIHSLLSEMQLPVEMTRQYLLYFANLPLAAFDVAAFPSFLADELYGFPIHNTSNGLSWFKAASHNFGITIKPEESRPIEQTLIEQTVERLHNLLPALRQTPLTHVDACMYDVTPDEDFILDTLPCDPRIVVATGLSGHGFKFGLMLGEILASLVQEKEAPVNIERFKISRFDKRRAGYGQQHVSVA
jgi:monomeric sarcosine oxidase